MRLEDKIEIYQNKKCLDCEYFDGVYCNTKEDCKEGGER